MVIALIGFAILLLVPVGNKAKSDTLSIDTVHTAMPPTSPAAPALEEAFEKAIPGHARLRCPVSSAYGGHALRAKSTQRFKGSTVRWLEIRDGHLNAATNDSIGETILYSGKQPIGVLRWSQPTAGEWTHCSVTPIEYVEGQGLIVTRARGLPVGGVTVNVCGIDVEADEDGRFPIRVPKFGSCDLRTHKIEGNHLFMGPERTVEGTVPTSSTAVKVREYGENDKVSLTELKDLAGRRLLKMETALSEPAYDPIQAALGLPDLSGDARAILSQWAQSEAEQDPRAQLRQLTTDEATLEDFRQSFWNGAMSDL